MKVSVFVEASSDGFIAGPGDNVDPFREAHERLVPKGESMGMKEYLTGGSVDAVVMGRKTFEIVRDMPKWWYEDLPVFVLSHDPQRVVVPTKLQQEKAKITCICGTPKEVLADLESRGYTHIHLDGGAQVIHSFMEEGLIDEVTVTTVPITLEDGIRFLSKEHWSKLTPKEETKYEFGYAKTKYAVTS